MAVCVQWAISLEDHACSGIAAVLPAKQGQKLQETAVVASGTPVL